MRRLPAVLFLLALAPSPLRAQPDPYRVEELASGVFAIVRKVPTTGASDSNVLFVINEADVVVVDTDIFPSSARQAIREIRRRTTKPVRFVINTHWHDDHVMGNEAYRQAWPGVTFISHPVARDSIVAEVLPSLRVNRETEYPGMVRRLEARLASGKTAQGTPLTPADRARLRDQLRLYRFFLQDTRGVTVVPPDLTVADSLVLHRGARTIVVTWLGRGNTPGDLVVWLPAERVLATGDLVVAPVPFAFGSFVEDWPGTLRRLRARPAATIVPGHGDVMHDWTRVDGLVAMLEDLGPRIAGALAHGVALDSTVKLVDASRWRAQVAGGDSLRGVAFDRLFFQPLVEASFNRARRR